MNSSADHGCAVTALVDETSLTVRTLVVSSFILEQCSTRYGDLHTVPRRCDSPAATFPLAQQHLVERNIAQQRPKIRASIDRLPPRTSRGQAPLFQRAAAIRLSIKCSPSSAALGCRTFTSVAPSCCHHAVTAAVGSSHSFAIRVDQFPSFPKKSAKDISDETLGCPRGQPHAGHSSRQRGPDADDLRESEARIHRAI